MATRQKFLGREQTPELEVAKAEGSFLYDTRGREYIDFVMGWCVANLGWAPPILEKRARHFKGPHYVFPEYGYRPWDELAALLASVAPGRLTRSFRATGGSEAVDLAIQAAMVHTGRPRFLSVEESYHGNTIAALSVGASENREKYPNLLSSFKIAPPLDESKLDVIETRLKKRNVAAFVMEPISINLGVLIPDRTFMTGLQRLCRRYGTLLVMDEVATGFGRTGAFFASEHDGVSPDVMCLGKAMSGGLAGIGAVMTTPAVAKSMEDDGSFYSTYGWHPRSVDLSIAVVRYMSRHRARLMAGVADICDYFRSRLSRMSFRNIEKLRLQGLAIGVDVGDESYASQIQSTCRRNGLLITITGSTLLLLPALTIKRDVAARGLDILEASL